MQVIKKIKNIQELVEQFKIKNKKIGFVPTMGALHDGHASLIKKARRENDIVVVSIFVNPTQFGVNEDFSQYPRPIAEDKKILEENNVDILFSPSYEEMYPRREDLDFYVDITKLSKIMCGKSRPIHFRGVATVVLKLLNIVMPHKIYFGQKDYQQSIIIRRMIEEFNIPVKQVVCPIVRERDGLALSSRNIYLSQLERESALCLYKSLILGKEIIKAGKIKDITRIVDEMKLFIKNNKKVKLDYIEIRNADNLEAIKKVLDAKRIVLAGAIFVGKTRLIDNIVV